MVSCPTLKTMGVLFNQVWWKLQAEFPSLIREVRGAGLMLGMELDREGEPFVTAMRERNILINCTDQTVLRFLPPLIIQETHVNQTLATLREIFSQQTTIWEHDEILKLVKERADAKGKGEQLYARWHELVKIRNRVGGMISQ